MSTTNGRGRETAERAMVPEVGTENIPLGLMFMGLSRFGVQRDTVTDTVNRVRDLTPHACVCNIRYVGKPKDKRNAGDAMNVRPFSRRIRAALKYKADMQNKTLAQLVTELVGPHVADIVPDWKDEL